MPTAMSAKRRAYQGVIPEENVGKKLKLEDILAGEKIEQVTEVGLALVNHLRGARDKRNRLIATEFLTLPDKKKSPEYYDAIVLPLALDVIEEKLQNHQYPSVSSIESDLKRMVSNAKQLNDRTSSIHGDAEKIRKMVATHMSRINPAYQDPDYIPFPTPLPGEDYSEDDKKKNANARSEPGKAAATDSKDPEEIAVEPDSEPEAEAEAEVEAEAEASKKGGNGQKKRMVLHLNNTKPSTDSKPSSPTTTQDTDQATPAAITKSFQEAQEQVISELIDLADEDGNSMTGLFINLPSRDLRDYYQLIKHPVSLKGVQKLVRGVKGREKPTGISFFKTWQAFEDETSYIWKNAREYNEEGSAIAELADELEQWFKKRVAEAKAAAPEPAQPRVKLRLNAGAAEPEPPVKIKLSVAGKNGVSIDTEALKRQTELVKAGVEGQKEPRATGSSASQGPGPSMSPPAAGGKENKAQLPSSSPVRGRRTSSAAGLERSPSSHGRRTSERTSTLTNGTAKAATPQDALSARSPSRSTPAPAPGPPPPPPQPVINWHENQARSWKEPTITWMKVYTHPDLGHQNPFRITLPPDKQMTQRRQLVHLDYSHSRLVVEAMFAPPDAGRNSIRYCLQGLPPQKLAERSTAADRSGSTRVTWEVEPNYHRDNVTPITVECGNFVPPQVSRSGPGAEDRFETITITLSYVHQY